MDPTRPNRVSSTRGTVTRGPYGKGTKSERDAVFIETADARYILRRKNGPSFGDTGLNEYIGHEIEVDGFLVGTTLLAEQIKIVDS